MNLLEGKKVTKVFGGLTAVDNVDFEIMEGEILGLIGPNGAGKTTLLNLINGMDGISRGEIFFQGHRLNNLKPHQIATLGITRAFQIVRTFAGMTAKENVLVGALFGSPNKIRMHEAEEIVEGVLESIGLYKKKDSPVSDLTTPDRKRLELGRALAAKPKLLLLDEVMAGLNKSEVAEFMETVRKINRSGITILMIEHIMKAVMGVSHRILVLHHGKKIGLGTPEKIAEDETVIESYLGKRFKKPEFMVKEK